MIYRQGQSTQKNIHVRRRLAEPYTRRGGWKVRQHIIDILNSLDRPKRIFQTPNTHFGNPSNHCYHAHKVNPTDVIKKNDYVTERNKNRQDESYIPGNRYPRKALRRNDNIEYKIILSEFRTR